MGWKDALARFTSWLRQAHRLPEIPTVFILILELENGTSRVGELLSVGLRVGLPY